MGIELGCRSQAERRNRRNGRQTRLWEGVVWGTPLEWWNTDAWNGNPAATRLRDVLAVEVILDGRPRMPSANSLSTKELAWTESYTSNTSVTREWSYGCDGGTYQSCPFFCWLDENPVASLPIPVSSHCGGM